MLVAPGCGTRVGGIRVRCEYGSVLGRGADIEPEVRMISAPGRVARTGFGGCRFGCELGIETMIGLVPGT